MPQAQEAMANATVDQRNSFTSPTRFASQPVIGMEIAFATPNEVITQVPWLNDEPRLPAMVGMATLAMVESSTCIKVASDSAMVIMTSCAPSSGFCCCITLTPNYPALAWMMSFISLLTGSRPISRALLS